jgi:hypothetical protein
VNAAGTPTTGEYRLSTGTGDRYARAVAIGRNIALAGADEFRQFGFVEGANHMFGLRLIIADRLDVLQPLTTYRALTRTTTLRVIAVHLTIGDFLDVQL